MLSIDKGAFGYSKSGPPVLTVENFHLEENTVVGLLGGNGAGKTTFIKGLSGLLPAATVEHMLCDGVALTPESPEFKASRLTVFTEDRSFLNWSFERYLSFVAAAYKRTDLVDVDGLIAGFNFGEFTTRRLGELSSGNAKKARLITAFAVSPKYLILDEPVDALDFLATEYLYQKISTARDHGTAVLMSSHVAESLTELADCLYVLQHGRMRGPHPVPTTRQGLKALLQEDLENAAGTGGAEQPGPTDIA